MNNFDQCKKLIVVRHAESTFIAAYKKRVEQFKKNETELEPEERERVYHEFALQPEYIDAQLTDFGISQC